MKTFRDQPSAPAQPREWRVDINVGTIKRVRDVAGVDLLGIVDGKLIGELTADPIKLVDVLYAACKPEADANGITPDRFADGLRGDALDAGLKAVLEDLADFFPQSKRQAMRAAISKVLATETAAMARATQRVEAMDVASLVDKAFGD